MREVRGAHGADGARMNQWDFVWAAYAIALGGTVAMTAWSWIAMRRAEKDGDR